VRQVIAVLVAVGALLLPNAAVADSGSITNVHPGLDSSIVSATYTSTSTGCDTDGFCGWYPHAWDVAASSACFVDLSQVAYVGDYLPNPGTQTATDDFYPRFNPTRICLYINGPFGETFLADYVYTAPATPPPTGTPTPTPTPTANPEPSVPPLKIGEARSRLPSVLREQYGRRYTSRRGPLKMSCYRLSSEKVRCRVGWNTRRYRYSGNATMWNDPDHPDSILFTTSIRRTRRATSAPPASKFEAAVDGWDRGS
jgi:hypothetical protein